MGQQTMAVVPQHTQSTSRRPGERQLEVPLPAELNTNTRRVCESELKASVRDYLSTLGSRRKGQFTW